MLISATNFWLRPPARFCATWRAAKPARGNWKPAPGYATRYAGWRLSQIPPEELRQSIQRQLRKMQPGFLGGSRRLTWALALALWLSFLGVLPRKQWIRVQRGRRIVASVLAIGVSDHVQCAIKGHNYPDIANPPEQLRQKLGPQYAGLLEVVQQKLPGFEVLEAHICSIPGSPRKYVHFITRGRGTILSVILTRSDGEQLPNGRAFRSGASGSVNLYEAHLEGMNAAGFESKEYLGFVVSDLSQDTTMQIASELAPPLKAALDAGSTSQTRSSLQPVRFRTRRGPTNGLFRRHPTLILVALSRPFVMGAWWGFWFGKRRHEAARTQPQKARQAFASL